MYRVALARNGAVPGPVLGVVGAVCFCLLTVVRPESEIDACLDRVREDSLGGRPKQLVPGPFDGDT